MQAVKIKFSLYDRLLAITALLPHDRRFIRKSNNKYDFLISPYKALVIQCQQETTRKQTTGNTQRFFRKNTRKTQIYQAVPLSLLQLRPMGSPEAISSQFFDNKRRYITSQKAQVHGMSFYVDISVGLSDHVCLASAELNR